MSDFYKVHIPGQLPQLNDYIRIERSNKFIAAKLKKSATTKCSLFFKHLKPLKRLGPVQFIWHHKDMRIDMDNREFSQKFVFDGMVKSGVIKGDGWKHRHPQTLHEHELNPDKFGVTVVFGESIPAVKI